MALKDFTITEIAQLTKESTSLSELARKLQYSSRGAILNTIKNYLEDNDIDYSHFTGRAKGQIKREEENVFIENSTASQRTLRRWYIKGEYTPYHCAICGQEAIWNEKELVLILDHINGKNHDDRLENLRWVCPNCNAQLETFGTRNIKFQMEG